MEKNTAIPAAATPLYLNTLSGISTNRFNVHAGSNSIPFSFTSHQDEA